MKQFFFVISLIAFIYPVCAVCQIGQLRPELCGKPNDVVPLPAGVSATMTDDDNQETKLFVKDNAAPLTISDFLRQITQVCPLQDGRLVAFGEASNGTVVYIIDGIRALLIDRFIAYSPVMSPDQRWIAFRRFYPRQHDLPVSEDYAVYDLSKNPSQNRPTGTQSEEEMFVGAVIFPFSDGNLLGDAIGLPESQQHSPSSEFFWAPAGDELVFADRLSGKTSLVSIPIASGARIQSAKVLPLTMSAPCAEQITGVIDVKFGPLQGKDRMLTVELDSVAGTCGAKQLSVHRADFAAAVLEHRDVVRPTRQTIPGK